MRENGRSMVEMLGVLAIIGVLSVGAIAGYSKAMMKYKLNKQTEQISQLLNLMYVYNSQWRFTTYTNITPYLIKLHEIPDGMRQDGTYLYDSFDNKILVSNNNAPSYNFTHVIISINQNNDYAICQNIMNVVKAHSGHIYNVFIGKVDENSNSSYTNYYYGDQVCGNKSTCVRNITQEQIYQMCQACINSKSCGFDIEWKIF